MRSNLFKKAAFGAAVLSSILCAENIEQATEELFAALELES